MSQKIRVSAVSFLNARPITYGLERDLGGERFELSFDLPSRCAERLTTGDADLGLIPVGAYATSATELRIVPGIAIASHGAVRTGPRLAMATPGTARSGTSDSA